MNKLRLALAPYRVLLLQSSVNEFKLPLGVRLLILNWAFSLSKGVLSFKEGSFWLNTGFLGAGSVLTEGWQGIWAFQVVQGQLVALYHAILSLSSFPVIERSGPIVNWGDFEVGSK